MEAFDDVVVGAGSAGCVVAARLSEDAHRRVLLVEAGPDYPTAQEVPPELRGRATSDSRLDHDWGYHAQVAPGRVVAYPQGKVTGGGSAINSAVALRAMPEDFAEWVRAGNDEWSWGMVLDAYRVLEADQDFGALGHHGAHGPLPIRRWRADELIPPQRGLLDACRQLGFAWCADLNHPAGAGVGPWPMNVQDGVRVSTAHAYLDPARSRGNLTVMPQRLARRLHVDDNRATGVEIEDPGGRLDTVEGRRIILAAGAINTPALLLRSGIGGGSALRDLGIEVLVDRPGVGANLADHPFAWLGIIPEPGVCDLERRSVQIGLRYTAESSVDPHDMQLLMVIPVDLSGDPALAREVGASTIIMLGAGLQRPRTRGRVRLTSADPHAPPHIDLNLFADPEDMRRLRHGLRLARRVVETTHLQPFVAGIGLPTREAFDDDDALDAHIRATTITFKHPVGTARMGPAGDPGAVVDQRGRVHGVEGLYVADASIMPTIPRANTNLTCIMIGERIAAWLRRS